LPWVPCGHAAAASDVALGALPESELAALPPEDNAELIKRLAERIREAADEYQRKMPVVH
jgi:thiamine monophosphate kinase